MEVMFLKKNGTEFIFPHPFDQVSVSKDDIILKLTCPVATGGTKRAVKALASTLISQSLTFAKEVLYQNV